MAIQIRRGSESDWESTNENIVAGEPAIALDTERFFIGTGSGTFAEFANVEELESLSADIDSLETEVDTRVISKDFILTRGVTPTSVTSNQYITATGVIANLSGTTGYSVKKYAVTEGNGYFLSASARNSYSVGLYAFYDNTDTLVLMGDVTPDYANPTNTNLESKLVCAPTGASYVAVSSFNQASSIPASLTAILQSVNQFNEQLKTIEYSDEHFVDITDEYTLASAYLDKNNGNAVAYASAETTDFLEITEHPVLLITGSPIYTSNALYALYDKYQNFLYAYKNGQFNYDYVFDAETILTAHPTAKYVRFSSVFASTGIHLIIKRQAYVNEATDYAIGYMKPWKTKKWCCVGDSLTEVNSRTTKHYFDYISERTEINIVNLGASGRGYKNPSSVDNKTFLDVMSEVPLDSDVVTIFGSGNDLTHGYTLGSPTDTGTTTICGCINSTIDALITRFPTVQLGIVAPTPWANYPPSTADNSMEQYVEALQTICANRSIPFLDLYHCSNLRPWTAEGRSACYSKDDGNGVHPDENGHKLIAPRFSGFLDFLLIR